MATLTTYSSISPRTNAYAVARLLKRALPFLVLEKFGQTYVMPKNKTDVAKFRRYNALPINTTPLTEGVTPNGQPLTVTDYTATLTQLGDFVTITDVIQDTHEDPVLQEASAILGEQAAQSVETMRWGILTACTNVFYANGTALNAVNTVLALPHQRAVTRALAAQNARPITTIVRSTPDWGTVNVQAGYVALAHPNLENDIRNMANFISSENYGTITPWENEIGKIENVRYLSSTIFAPKPDAGGAIAGLTTPVLSTTGTDADIYQIAYIARDAYGIVPLKGQNAVDVMVVNPHPAPSDPLAQRGTAGWKSFQTAVILNDAWMAILNVGCSAIQ